MTQTISFLELPGDECSRSHPANFHGVHTEFAWKHHHRVPGMGSKDRQRQQTVHSFLGAWRKPLLLPTSRTPFFVFVFLMDHGPSSQGPGRFSIPLPHVLPMAATHLHSFISPICYSVPAGCFFRNHRKNKTNGSKYIKSPVSVAIVRDIHPWVWSFVVSAFEWT